MKLYSISLNSLKRRKAKTIFLILGLVIAVASVITMITASRSINQSIAKNMDEFGANILIVPKSDELRLSYGGINVSSVSIGKNEITNEDVELIKTIKNKDNISIVSPKLIKVGAVNEKDVLVVGIDFSKELRLKKWWRLTGNKPAHKNEIIVGSELNKQLNGGLNKIIKVNGKEFIISAILESTGSEDDNVIFMNLQETQNLFNKSNSVSMVEIAALCYDCPIEEIVRQTSAKLPGAKVSAIRQTIESKMDAMHRFEHFSLGISIVILIINGMIVFANVSSSVNDRTREIGIFRAVGFKQKHIIKIILLEIFVVSLIAGLLGYLAGLVSSEILIPVISMSNNFNVHYDYNLLLLAVALSITVGFVSSIYPAFRASRLDPTVALRAL